MQKLKNRIKSSQLWQIISLWISIQKFQNFAHSSLNSPFTQIDTNIENKYLNKIQKSKKPVGGVCLSQDWSQNFCIVHWVSPKGHHG